MRPSKINEIIAYHDGWREAFPSQGPAHPLTKGGGILLPYHYINERTKEKVYHLPDYTNDLNRIWEAIKITLRGKDIIQYRSNDELYQNIIDSICEELQVAFFHLDAIHFCEALLKMIGKWEIDLDSSIKTVKLTP